MSRRRRSRKYIRSLEPSSPTCKKAAPAEPREYQTTDDRRRTTENEHEDGARQHNRAPSSPSPLVGEGWGGGSIVDAVDATRAITPTPTRGPRDASREPIGACADGTRVAGCPADPSPQGGGEEPARIRVAE